MNQNQFIYALAPPSRHLWCDVGRGDGEKVIHASPLSHMEIQQSAQPVLPSNDGLFEWCAQPLRITG